MGISESIMNHTIKCCENICDDVDCEIDSGCCKTKYSNSPRNHNKKDSSSEESENENNIKTNIIIK